MIMKIDSIKNTNQKINFKGTLKFTNLARKVEEEIITSKELDKDLFQKAVNVIHPVGSNSMGQDFCSPKDIKNYAELLFNNLSKNLTEGIKMPDEYKMCHFHLDHNIGYYFELPKQFKIVHYINK